MAVDANVIVFTRISEELGTGKTVRSSIKKGFEKALSAIVDGNVTTRSVDRLRTKLCTNHSGADLPKF